MPDLPVKDVQDPLLTGEAYLHPSTIHYEEEPMADEGPTLTTHDTLLAYSEWLDSEHLIVGDSEVRREAVDKRSHDALATAFIEWWESDEDRKPLAGRALAHLGRMLQRAFDPKG